MATLNTSPEISAGPGASDRKLAATVGKSALFGVLATAAQIGSRLISVPIVIHYLGLGGYGIWSIIMVTAGYMRFGSAGVKCAFQKYVAEATGDGDFDRANKLVSTGAFVLLALSALGLIPAAVFSQRIAEMSGVPAAFLPATSASIRTLACMYVIANFGSAFEAIVMGVHRIDLTRKCNTILTMCEAAGTVLLLHWGYGLLAMTLVMCASEAIFICFCYFASRHVAPQVRVGLKYFTSSVFPELVRFAGSYQLLNVLELVYMAILPLLVLKHLGAEAAGTFAVASRVVTSALIAQDALVLPILSAGTMVFASGDTGRAKLLLAKSFKATVAAAVPPLAFVSVFGATMVAAWTGDANPLFRTALWLVALTGLLKAISVLQLVLYRASGKALLDNVRQALRIVVILIVGLRAASLGFAGLLAGMALADLIGVVFMFVAMAATFHGFNAKLVVKDTLKISAATALIIGAGALCGMLPVPLVGNERMAALLRLATIGVGCLAAAGPAAILTQAMSLAERRVVRDTVYGWRNRFLRFSRAAA